MNYKDACNIAFIKNAKITTRDVLVLPAVNKQQGQVNYVVVCQGDYSGVYKWPGELRDSLRIWKNKEMPCYVITLDKLTKIKELDQIDEDLPYGKFMLRIIRKINDTD